MYDDRLMPIIRGEAEPCPACEGRISKTDSCTVCHRTGYAMPSPEGSSAFRVEVVAIYEGAEADSGERSIATDPARYEVVRWFPCCELMRGEALNTVAAKFHIRLHRSYLHVHSTVDRTEDLFESGKSYPTLRSDYWILRYCPNCGKPVRVEVVRKKAEIVKKRKKMVIVDTATVEVEL